MNETREEDFGYIVFNKAGNVSIVGPEAKDHLRVGEIINQDMYKPAKLRVRVPFHLRSPLVVMFEVTRRCNVTCGHCYLSAGEPRKNEMDTETIFDVLDQLRKMKVFHIFITGGEPFLRSDIADIINYARECNFFVNVITNGTLLTDEILSQIKKDGRPPVISMSYLGGLKNGLSNDEAFDLLKKKVALLKNHGFLTLCWFSITKLNIDKRLEVAQWCLDNGVWIDDREVMPIGRCKENTSLLLDVDDLEKSMQDIPAEREDYFPPDPDQSPGTIRDVFDIIYILEHSVKACKGGRTFAYICSNGDVYPCSNCASEGLFLGGNVTENTFSHIWENSFKNMRRITWSDFKGCETCELKEYLVEGKFCKLRCPPLSKILHNDILYCGATEYQKAKSKVDYVWKIS